VRAGGWGATKGRGPRRLASCSCSPRIIRTPTLHLSKRESNVVLKSNAVSIITFYRLFIASFHLIHLFYFPPLVDLHVPIAYVRTLVIGAPLHFTRKHPCKIPRCPRGGECKYAPFRCTSCGGPHKATDRMCHAYCERIAQRQQTSDMDLA
jgi:hypothetical protein